MPNWCSNRIAFFQKDGGNSIVNAFYADVQKYQNFIDPDTGKHSDWAGHWLTENRINTDSIYCRGFFSYCELYPDHVFIEMETAWGPLPELWDKMAEKYGLVYVYISEECGCEVYINSDVDGRYFSARFMLNYFDLDYLELDSETLSKYGERLNELSMEPRYYDNFMEVLNDFEEFGFDAENVDELNLCLDKLGIKIHEFKLE